VLYVALRCVDNLKTMLAPFLPFSSQRLHAMLGYDDLIAPQPTVQDLGTHRIITGDYDHADRWHPSRLEPGRKLPEPQPLFKRLDEVPELEGAPSS
jgi:methionyl-tRNA synthetase